MRTTVSIDDKLLRAAKRRARQRGLTLGQLVEEGLRRVLARPPRSSTPHEIPVIRGGTGLRPGVDASSTRGLLEAAERDLPLDKRK
jgi:hypothetical protein